MHVFRCSYTYGPVLVSCCEQSWYCETTALAFFSVWLISRWSIKQKGVRCGSLVVSHHWFLRTLTSRAAADVLRCYRCGVACIRDAAHSRSWRLSGDTGQKALWYEAQIAMLIHGRHQSMAASISAQIGWMFWKQYSHSQICFGKSRGYCDDDVCFVIWRAVTANVNYELISGLAANQSA